MKVNDILGDYTIIDEYPKNMRKFYKYQCKCGKIGNIRSDYIKDNYECNHANKYLNKVYGRWKIIDTCEDIKNKTTVLCECSCDKHTKRKIPLTALIHKETLSCGCIKIERLVKPTDFKINGDLCTCNIRTKIVSLDFLDYDKVKNFGWCINGTGYVVAWSSELQRMISMHRLILKCNDEMIVDHIDGNPLNNRRYNLRGVYPKQNAINQKLQSNNTSGHKGVHWHKGINKWIANIGVDNKLIHLGYFINIEDAIIARENAEKIFFKEFNREKEYL
jgi:hypothetical protein